MYYLCPMKHIYPSPFGNIILISNHGKLVYANWNSEDCKQKLKRIESCIEHSLSVSPDDIQILKEAENQLSNYFSGKLSCFGLALEFIGTAFQKKVWEILLTLRYGQKISYKELAILCGKPKSVRAVASACGANPLAIFVPCHRVVASGGETGGYTGGVDKKIALLELESANTLNEINDYNINFI